MQSERLIFRKFSLDDIDDVFEFGNDDETCKFVTWDKHKNILESEKVITDYVEGLIDFQNMITLFRVQKQKRDARFLETVIFEGGTISKNKIVASINDNTDTILNKFKKEKLGTQGLH